MTNQKKQNEHKGGMGSMVAAMTGAVVGAGIAIAGAVALKDEKNVQKIKEIMTNVKDQAVGHIEDIKKNVEHEKTEIDEQIAEGKEKANKIASTAKDTLDQVIKDIKKGSEKI
jgi:outer membrane murein-binding lipoprotein Lpp